MSTRPTAPPGPPDGREATEVTGRRRRWSTTVVGCVAVTVASLGAIALTGGRGIACANLAGTTGCTALPRHLTALVSAGVVALSLAVALASARRLSPLRWSDVVARPIALGLVGLTGYVVTANALSIW